MDRITVRELLAKSGNYGGSRTASQIKYLVVHYTGNDGDTAANNARYYANNVVRASAHYFVDDTTVYRSVPDLTVAWAVGGTKWSDCAKTGGGTMCGKITNTNSISVELCDTAKDGAYGATEATLSNAAKLCRELMELYGIPVENVYRHFDVTGKHCPAYMMDASVWSAFKSRLKEVEPVSINNNIPDEYAKEAVSWAQENGILLGGAGGNLDLHQPCTRQHVIVWLWRLWKLLKK